VNDASLLLLRQERLHDEASFSLVDLLQLEEIHASDLLGDMHHFGVGVATWPLTISLPIWYHPLLRYAWLTWY
jgi:hypothetical protein